MVTCCLVKKHLQIISKVSVHFKNSCHGNFQKILFYDDDTDNNISSGSAVALW